MEIPKEQALTMLPEKPMLVIGLYAPPALVREMKNREEVVRMVEEAEMTSIADDETTEMGMGLAILYEDNMYFVETSDGPLTTQV